MVSHENACTGILCQSEVLGGLGAAESMEVYEIGPDLFDRISEALKSKRFDLPRLFAALREESQRNPEMADAIRLSLVFSECRFLVGVQPRYLCPPCHEPL
jgi:hypothetical protein